MLTAARRMSGLTLTQFQVIDDFKGALADLRQSLLPRAGEPVEPDYDAAARVLDAADIFDLHFRAWDWPELPPSL